MAEADLAEEYKETIEVMSQQLLLLKSKLNEPSELGLAKLKVLSQASELKALSEKILQEKQKL